MKTRVTLRVAEHADDAAEFFELDARLFHQLPFDGDREVLADQMNTLVVAFDPGEANDLSDLRPNLTRDLHAQLTAWRKRVGAIVPAEPNPEYVPVGGK